jgi:hypothetical protein
MDRSTEEFARSFPALQHAAGVSPWDPNALHRLGPRSLVGLPYSNREVIHLSAANHS